MKILLTVSSPPHIYGKDSISKRMRDVLIALSPAAAIGIYTYGNAAFFTIIIAVVSAVVTEFIYKKVFKKPVTINDLSAVITGLLLAFNLPPDVPFWIPIAGSVFAIIAIKQLFGGLGQNFINPALGARAFLLTSFPSIMTKWRLPDVTSGATPDALSGVTFLAKIKRNPGFTPETSYYIALLFNKVGGCIGEASAAALIIGGIYLIIRKTINWRIPVFYIGSFIIFALIFGRQSFLNVNILFEVLSGGLLLGAFFMATDYATSPITPKGKVIMGIGCGLFTVLIRFFGGYPEGVSYAILIMNLFVPMIDKYVRPRVYGTKAGRKGKKDEKYD
jgi:electron transport complex protein RnfD